MRTVATGIGMVLWIPFLFVRSVLESAGLLSTKDLPPFVGHEVGSISDYVLNVWHWDVATFLLGVTSIACVLWTALASTSETEREGIKQHTHRTSAHAISKRDPCG